MTLTIGILTFNCARAPINPILLSSHLSSVFFSTTHDAAPPDILCFSLQEVAPIAYAFLGGSYLSPYLLQFHNVVQLLSFEGNLSGEDEYTHILTRNVGMTAIILFAKRSLAGNVRNIETAGVGTGLWEMGNKGAVGVRLGLTSEIDPQPQDSDADDDSEDLTLLYTTFIAAHLAPAETGLERRNKDWENIVRRLSFMRTISASPTSQGSSSETLPLLAPSPTNSVPTSIYSPPTPTFLAGDLNYRTASQPPSASSPLVFPSASPNTPADAPTHFTYLLPNDQLTRERNAHRTCHGFDEAPIKFPPTYKYSSEAMARADKAAANKPLPPNQSKPQSDYASHRWPSWCDRILSLSPSPPSGTPNTSSAASPTEPNTIKTHHYTSLPLLPSSDHQPVVQISSIPSTPPSPADLAASKPPFPLTPHSTAQRLRASARRLEVVVGVLAYLALTWKGRGIVAAVLVGGVGGWWLVGGLLSSTRP
ncbi:MAG: hypothetical protein M1833_007299 [Piccolia ochrophora]|nr:MAG: hypothetical protein M1833_007299 [Piccolia ochrophora]